MICMISASRFKKHYDNIKEALHVNLSRHDARLQPALLGLVAGILSGAVVVLFRFAIESGQTLILPGGIAENFEELAWVPRLLLPIISGVLIGLLFTLLAQGRYVVGVVHVIERLGYFQGIMETRRLLLQFVGATLALLGGHSVGREGPSVHMGAAVSSLLGQRMRVPNNMLRILVASGSAAAISASFNTPLAGVIFAMEVIMMEYTIASFLPVILAAVSATSISISVFGDAPVFSIPPFSLDSLSELPTVAIIGLCAGLVSTLLIKLLDTTAKKTQNWPYLLKTSLAGVIVGLCAVSFPQVMGVGYDSVNDALLSQLGLMSLLGILAFKMIATTAAIGLGIPGGLIGPTLFIGAMLGSTIGYINVFLFPDASSDAGVYALLGMGAMMAAMLQAPLAALTAILELTSNPTIVFPGMLAIVVAELTRSELFRQPSVFQALLLAQGLDYNANPLTQSLLRIGVASVMSRQYSTTPATITLEQANLLLQKEPQVILIEKDGTPEIVMPAVDLLRYLDEEAELKNNEIDLMEIPADRCAIKGVHQRATLLEADKLIHKHSIDMLYVYDTPAPTFKRTKGVLSKKAIESAYRI